MGYPTSPASFPTHVTGEVVRAAHLNAYADEIEAVESTWLKSYGQTSAPFRVRGVNPGLEFGDGTAAGGGSTLFYQAVDTGGFLGFHCEPGTNPNTLKTRGIPGAILGGNGVDASFVMASAQTAAADNQAPGAMMTVSPLGCLQFLANAYCLLRNTTPQTVAHNTMTALTFDTEDADASALHATGSASVIIPATKVGWFLITASTRFQPNATGYRGVYLHLNGNIVCFTQARNCGASISSNVTLIWLLQLAANDTVEIRVRHMAGVSIGVGDTVREQQSQFALVRLG